MRRSALSILVVTIAVVAPLLIGPSPGHIDHVSHANAAFAQSAPCWPSDTPLGALPPAVPIWCTAPTTGPSTFVQDTNSWLDEFDHGLTNADLGPGYRTFDRHGQSINEARHFRHADHWMVDVNGRDRTPADGPHNFGGATMRPDRSFRFVDGALIIEADVAAGIEAYIEPRGFKAWPEIVVTTAPAPTSNHGLYNTDLFGGHWTVGCILFPKREVSCRLLDDSGRSPEANYVWKASFFERAGSYSFGGEPGAVDPDTGHVIGNAWRVCRGTDPDLHCRDRFRLELTRTSLTLFANGVRYFEQGGFTGRGALPDALVNGDVYVYFGSWIAQPAADTVRFHWDRLAVNPDVLLADRPIVDPPTE